MRFANPFPSGGDRRKAFVGEATAFRPDTSVEDADDDVLGVIGVRPEAEGISQAEEVRGSGGMKVADAVGDDGEDAGETAELFGLGKGEAGGEAAESAVVGVEEFGGGREGTEDGGVPVVVGGENGWLMKLGNVDDVSLTIAGGERWRDAKEEEEEKDGEKWGR